MTDRLLLSLLVLPVLLVFVLALVLSGAWLVVRAFTLFLGIFNL